jgi:hypothetical protein
MSAPKDCYNQDTTNKWDVREWGGCDRPGYFVQGLGLAGQAFVNLDTLICCLPAYDKEFLYVTPDITPADH